VIDSPNSALERLRRSRKHLFWLVAKGLITLLAVVAFLSWALTVTSPSGVLLRKVERDNPMASPVPVLDIQGDQIVIATKSFNLAGVRLPGDSRDLASALEFLQVCTAQGIEVIRQVTPSSWTVRCEPRIYHWCGVDPVAAHYEQHNLNELIVALGYAFFEDSTDLTEAERARLKAAAMTAKRNSKGIWSNGTPDEEHRMSENGLNISEVTGVDAIIRHLSR
jgi:hypothetical protein